MIKKELNKNTIVVAHRSHRMADVIDFWKEIDKIYREGYVFQEPKLPRDCPVMPLLENLQFVKKTSSFEKLTKKVELLAYAEEKGIEVPEDKQKNPAMIRKTIREILTEKKE